MSYKSTIKPILDFLLADILFLILFPIFLTIVFILSVYYLGNPFFFQSRIGLRGEIFTIIKFKTMSDRKDENGLLMPDSVRLSLIGSFLRKSSLDELPQLLNIMKGEMSLIGPRPLLIEYQPLYNEIQIRRNLVKPGITGWAQVNGRNVISWDKKFEYDVWYVDNISFSLDFKILLLTLRKVFKGGDINQVGQATVEKFIGNN
jgi:lipopolysaccharide/colanic/teichoic acid biosynthesis glycosyltransferase